MEANNEQGETFPLYDEVKRNIYRDFQDLKRITSSLFNSKNNSDYKINIRIYQERFSNLYLELNHKTKLNKIDVTEQKYLKLAYECIVSNKMLSKDNVSKITIILRKLIEELGITKIEGKNKDKWAF